ncbi:MAG: hypothetical protein AAF152_17590 [Cyanobacteria bacterium P01_A01_bin.114]
MTHVLSPSSEPSADCPAEYPIDYMVTELDALGYVNQCWWVSIVLIMSYVWAVQGAMPIAGLILVVILTLPRWIISVHELLHIYAPEQLNRIICLLGSSPVPLSPLTLGYGEIRAIHLAHHRAPTTDADPDAYHIRGSSGWVFLNAMTTHEQDTMRWISTHGLSLSLAIELVIKFGILGTLAWFGGATFWWFWLTLRLVYGVSDFIFFRCVHCQKGSYGNFALSLPPALLRIGEWIYGKTVVHATLNHDLHHQYPGLAARNLTLARERGKGEGRRGKGERRKARGVPN